MATWPLGPKQCSSAQSRRCWSCCFWSWSCDNHSRCRPMVLPTAERLVRCHRLRPGWVGGAVVTAILQRSLPKVLLPVAVQLGKPMSLGKRGPIQWHAGASNEAARAVFFPREGPHHRGDFSADTKRSQMAPSFAAATSLARVKESRRRADGRRHAQRPWPGSSYRHGSVTSPRAVGFAGCNVQPPSKRQRGRSAMVTLIKSPWLQVSPPMAKHSAPPTCIPSCPSC